MFRGPVSMAEAETELDKYIKENERYFYEWIPFNNCVSFCKKARPEFRNSASLVMNNSAIQETYK